MKIRQVIKEAAGVSAAFAFGRFNPAHQGHIAVWQTVERAGVKWYIGTNPTTIGANDPLTFEQKSAWMQAIYPQIAGHIVPETSVMTLAARIFKELGSKEDATIAYITDADDWAWSGKLLNQYNGVEGKHGYYKFAQIVHVPSPRVSSATALRDAARADDKVAFYHASGTDPKLKVAGKTYFDTVKEAVTKYPLPVKKAKKTEGVAEGPEFDKWANDRAASQLHKLKPSTLWEVSFDYGPHQSDSVKVKARSAQEAVDKVETAAEKKGRSIMVNWARPAEQGVGEGIMSKIANKVMGAAPEQPQYKVGQRVKYETSPHQPDWADGGSGVGVITDYKNGHYMINGNPVNHFEIKGVVAEMDSPQPKGRYKADGIRSHSTYGSRDDYELGSPETTLGSDSIAKPKDVAKQGLSVLHKALDRALSKEKKASPQQVQRNKERWAQRQAEREQGVDEASLATMRDYFAGDENAKDPTKLSQMRDFFSKHKPEGRVVDKNFNSKSSYEAWLKQQKMKKIGEDEEAGEVKKTGTLIPFPKGTTKIDVGGEYDWYKLGQVISDLDDADPAQFGQGPASAMIAFGSEAEEHKYMPLLKRLGMRLHDIDQPTEGVEIIPVAEFISRHQSKLEAKFTDYELAVMEGGHSLPEAEKIAGRYDPADFDSMVQRLSKIAKAGPMKTVWDPEKRVYKNVPDTDKQKKIAEAVVKVVEVIKQRNGLWKK